MSAAAALALIAGQAVMAGQPAEAAQPPVAAMTEPAAAIGPASPPEPQTTLAPPVSSAQPEAPQPVAEGSSTPASPADAVPPTDENAIVVQARTATPADPLADINAKTFEAVQAVDQAVVGPVAQGYRKKVPSPIRSGLRNFLRNLEEPVSALNYLLQLKPGRAVKSVGRFTLNSTMGWAGLFDVAKRKPFNLPYVPNGFANTFACYGVGPGPYFFLPVAGPITLRDLVGLSIDKAIVPAAVGKPLNTPYYAVPAITIDALNDRIEIDAHLEELRANSPDPYVATRELYLRQRKAEIAAICPRKSDGPIDPALPPRPGKGAD